MGVERNRYFVRIRPYRKEEGIIVRADAKKKEGGQFKAVACWLLPPRDRNLGKEVVNIMEPNWKSSNW